MSKRRVGKGEVSPAGEQDRRMIRRAIHLATRGEGRVEPNPMVGCVIARSGRILGEGFHRRFGGPHAEAEALLRCREDLHGATAYVSLEPCCHHGQTPPCADALVEAGVSRVVIACRDPHPAVRGGGIRRLRSAHIAVDVGVLRSEAVEVLAPFLTRLCLGRPYVIAKWAQSLDGKLATRRGDSKWISCEASRRRVHRLRARVDAILVGSGTALRDDPLLTARDVPLRRRAMRVVLDRRLRVPESSRLVKTADVVATMVLTLSTCAHSAKARRLQAKGVEIIPCRLRKQGVSLHDCLRILQARGVTNLLVEGGPTVLSSFLQAGLVDEALVFTAPKLIGSHDAPGPLDGCGFASVEEAITAQVATTRRCGVDILHRLRLTKTPRLSPPRSTT